MINKRITLRLACSSLAAATMLAASPALAQADATWSSIFVEHNGTRWGASDNYPTKAAAVNAANDDCQRTGAAVCVFVAAGKGCVSAARNAAGDWNGAYGANRDDAERLALAGNGGYIVVTRC